MNMKKRTLSLLMAAALVVSMPLGAQAAGSISGSVRSSGNEKGKVTLNLLDRGGVQVVQTVGVIGNNGSYLMENVEDGQYTLQASKYKHVTREYDVTVADGTLTQDVKLNLRGDVNGDGYINVGDTSMAYAHVRKTSLLKDAYQVSCADMNGDGNINVGDVGNIYSSVRNPGGSIAIPPLPQTPVEDHKEEPIEIGGTLIFEAVVDAGHLSYFNLFRVSDTSLTIESPMAYVIYNGVTYEAVDGKVTVPELHCENMNTPTTIAIGNRGPEDLGFDVVLTYPQGHQMNPITQGVGKITAFCAEGNDQGVFFRFTATKAGNLNIRRPQGVDCNISITSDVVEGGTRSMSFSDVPEDQLALSFPMVEGESVLICVVMNPQNGYNYPEATVSTRVTFL